MALAGGTDAFRLGVDQVIHDGEIVRRQVPNHVDIMLKQAEVDARGIVIEELSEDALVDQLADLPDGASEKERVIDHDLQLPGGREIDQLRGLRRRRGERLLDKHVLAVFECRLGELEVGPDGRDHRHRVDVGRTDDLRNIAGDLYAWMRFPGAFLRGGIRITDGGQLTAIGGLKVPGHNGSPITIADYSDSNHASSESCMNV